MNPRTIKRAFLNSAARILGAAALTRVLERWNARRGGVILAYHEISEAQLLRQLTALSELCTFVPLSEFVRRLLEGKSTARLAAITFDDGYGPVVESAARLASLYGWPMTFYLPTGYVDTGHPYWYQELPLLLQRATTPCVTIEDLTLSLSNPVSLARAAEALDRRFRSLSSEEEVARLLRKTRRALIGSDQRPTGLPIAEPVSWERVRQLAAREELSFEAHSVNHLSLNRLSDERIRQEMEQSRDRIQEASGRPVNHFCYPFGGVAEIGERAVRAARSHFQSR